MVEKFFKNQTVGKAGIKVMLAVFICLMMTISTSGFAKEGELRNEVVDFVVIEELRLLYKTDAVFKTLMDKALSKAVTPPGGCTKKEDLGPMKDLFKLNSNEEFCWQGRPFSDLVIVFESWLKSLVLPNKPYTGFEYYTMLYSLAYENNWAQQFLETEPGLSWTKKFTEHEYMQSPSLQNGHIEIMHKIGRVILIQGQQMHCAHDITSGERYNLIMWCKSINTERNATFTADAQTNANGKCSKLNISR